MGHTAALGPTGQLLSLSLDQDGGRVGAAVPETWVTG